MSIILQVQRGLHPSRGANHRRIVPKSSTLWGAQIWGKNANFLRCEEIPPSQQAEHELLAEGRFSIRPVSIVLRLVIEPNVQPGNSSARGAEPNRFVSQAT